MWEYILGICVTALIGGVSYYFYKNRYNDEIIELLNIVHNDIKCIKYYYRGNKYIFLTENLDDNIKRLEKEIDPTNPDKDKKPEMEYKYIKVKLYINNTDKTDKTNLDKTDLDNTDKTDLDNTDLDNTENTEEEKYEEITIEELKLLYALIGPANSFYFAFDVDYYKKLTKFMNFLFETEEGMLLYGRFSALLNPHKYFDIKSKIIEIKKNNIISRIEWSLE